MTAGRGRSTEAKGHKLRNIAKGEARRPLGSRIRARFAEIGLDEDLPELRGEVPRPARFEE
jgi:antitoxin FitA